MRSVGRALYRTIFWSYERGTWPYDIAVVAIVVFVLLTPRHWFHDSPQLGPPPSNETVVLLDEDPATSTKTYRVDARLLASPIRTPELEHDLHEAVRKNISGYQGRTFTILRVDPIRDDSGTIVAYEIRIRP
jgi:hypothetical protein